MNTHEFEPRETGKMGGRIYSRGMLDDTSPAPVSRLSIRGVAALEASRVQSELSLQTEHALLTSPEVKKMLRAASYGIGVSIWAELHEDKMTENQLEAEKEKKLMEFNRFPRESQIILGQELTSSNQIELNGKFNRQLHFLQFLLTEGGEAKDRIGEIRNIWERLFKNKPQRRQLEELKHLRSEVDSILVARFESHYLKSWAELLRFTDIGDAAVEEETVRLKKEFQSAPQKIQAKMAKDLRYKVQTWPSTQFEYSMNRYRELVNIGALKVGRRGVFSEEEWTEKFNEANSQEEKMKIAQVFELVVSRFHRENVGVVSGRQEQKVVFDVKKGHDKSDHDLFLDAASNGNIENKDELIETVEERLSQALKGYEKHLRSYGLSAKEAKKLAGIEEKSLMAKIFGASDKGSFSSTTRVELIEEAQEFISHFLPKDLVGSPA